MSGPASVGPLAASAPLDSSALAAPLLQSGLDAVVGRYAAYGPLAASFLANLLATVGDKGQLAVVTLASRYDARRVFAGSMTAFGVWSALEVAFGRWITAVLPGDLITLLTGGLFLLFGAWTARSAIRSYRAVDGRAASDGGGLHAGLSGRLLPESLLDRIGSHGGVFAGFLFVLFAEFGDKTQLLTINLAATFPGSPAAVFVGVLAALGLRTGVDALIGERMTRLVPTRVIEVGAAMAFLGFGLVVLDVLSMGVLIGALAALGPLALIGALRDR